MAVQRKQYKIYLCGLPEEPTPSPGPTPDCDHTPEPKGYLQWHEWAQRMIRTHRQRQCPHCGLWAIWTLK